MERIQSGCDSLGSTLVRTNQKGSWPLPSTLWCSGSCFRTEKPETASSTKSAHTLPSWLEFDPLPSDYTGYAWPDSAVAGPAIHMKQRSSWREVKSCRGTAANQPSQWTGRSRVYEDYSMTRSRLRSPTPTAPAPVLGFGVPPERKPYTGIFIWDLGLFLGCFGLPATPS